MQLTVTTWNINSVRARIDQVCRFLESRRRTFCACRRPSARTTAFPLKELQSFGYPHVVHAGQKGYNGVAILSRLSLRRDGASWRCAAAPTRATSP